MVKQWLKDCGYIVFRCAGSKPMDLIALKEGKVLLVECKYGKNPRLDMREISEWDIVSKKVGAEFLVCKREKEGPLEFLSPRSGELKEVISL